MTKEQLKRILSNCVITAAGVSCPAEGADGAALARQLADIAESGANVLLVPQAKDGDALAAAVALTQQAAGTQAFVAGTLWGGVSVKPFGALSFDQCVEHYRAQAQIQAEAGVSLFYLGGFRDIFSARCAVLAVKDICTLPFIVGLDFQPDANGRLLLEYGTDPVCALVTLQSMGADAVGYCGSDCDDAMEVLLAMKEFSTIPLLCLPNLEGCTLTPYELAEYLPSFVNCLCAVTGFSQCPAEKDGSVYAGQLCKQVWQTEPFPPDFPHINALSSYRDVIFMDFAGQPVGRDETMFLKLDKYCKNVDQVIETMVTQTDLPATFEIDDETVLERVLRLYPGRCGIQAPEDLQWLVNEYSAPILVIEPPEANG